jgi:hypothetical protein
MGIVCFSGTLEIGFFLFLSAAFSERSALSLSFALV